MSSTKKKLRECFILSRHSTTSVIAIAQITCETKHSIFFDNFNFRMYKIAGIVIKKVKVTLVQALRLCTGRTAHRGSGGIALPFHDHGTRRE